MTDIQFGRLTDLPLREAWKHEAHDFTPWLAENIDHLSEVIGVPLELTGTEVAVESFSADILARNPEVGTVVLIENQLEITDHTHLGQILTYLAGLNAQTVVWIAPEFRQPHRTSIRWLNEHTADGFSFFAVKARVVRIGDSPYAPIFEVVEKPDDWERALTQKKREAATSGDANTETRIAFWTHYANRHPKAAQDGIKPRKAWNSYFSMAGGSILISVWVGEKTAGIYVRGNWGEDKFSARDILGEKATTIAESLEAQFTPDNSKGHLMWERLPVSYLDENNWDAITDWMEERRLAYVAAIKDALDLNE